MGLFLKYRYPVKVVGSIKYHTVKRVTTTMCLLHNGCQVPFLQAAIHITHTALEEHICSLPMFLSPRKYSARPDFILVLPTSSKPVCSPGTCGLRCSASALRMSFFSWHCLSRAQDRFLPPVQTHPAQALQTCAQTMDSCCFPADCSLPAVPVHGTATNYVTNKPGACLTCQYECTWTAEKSHTKHRSRIFGQQHLQAPLRPGRLLT